MTQTTVRTVLATIAACGLAASAMADVPTYTLELIARTDVDQSGATPDTPAFRFTTGTRISSATPSINDAGDVAIKASDTSGVDSVWFGDASAFSSLYSGPTAAALVSDPTLDNSGRIVFPLSGAAPADGIYSIDTTAPVPTGGLVTALPTGATFWSTPERNASGKIGYRASVGFGAQVIGAYDPATNAFTPYEADVGAGGTVYSFLGSPEFNDADQLASRVIRASDMADLIVRFNPDGSETVIARDNVADPASPYRTFSNSVDLNDNGFVAFVASFISSGQALLVSNGVTTVEIARTGAGGLGNTIESFRPALNNDNLVAFRALDDLGLRAVFVGDGSETRKIAARASLVPTDLPSGDAEIAPPPNQPSDPVFGGSPSINDAGDVAFVATLASLDFPSLFLGSGLYIAVADRPTTCPADFDNSGVVDVADIFAFLSAWFAQGPGSDFDNSGATDVSDIFAFLSAWFAGCP